MTIHHQDDRVTVYAGDCVEVLRTLPDNSIDSIVTDPPYGLEFMGKEWDAPWKTSQTGRGARVAIERASEMTEQGSGHSTSTGPYLAARVDSTRVAGKPFQDWCELWAIEALRVLKPGGHMLAFGGTRTWHRLACAVEDAGFEIRDSIAWMYGSGFPKSRDVSKAIDKRGGNAHLAVEIGAAIKAARTSRGWTTGQADQHFCNGSTNWTWFEGRPTGIRPPTPATFARLAAEWPELALLAEKVAEADREVVGKGQAGLGGGSNGPAHDGGYGTEYNLTAPATSEAQQWAGWGTALKPAFEPIVVARKPLEAGTVAANVLLHGTGALNIDASRIAGVDAEVGRTRHGGGVAFAAGASGFTQEPGTGSAPAGRWPANVVLDESQALLLDKQSGMRPGFSTQRDLTARAGGDEWGNMNKLAPGIREGYNDTGGASRFFLTAKRDPEAPAGGDFDCCQSSTYSPLPINSETAERFKYCAKAPKSERPTVDGVAHPTVKPLALMRWLVRLVTPPGGRVLDMFGGSGATVEAALLEDFAVTVVEREPDYLPLISERIRRFYAADYPTGFGNTHDAFILKPAGDPAVPFVHPDQLDLFSEEL